MTRIREEEDSDDESGDSGCRVLSTGAGSPRLTSTLNEFVCLIIDKKIAALNK